MTAPEGEPWADVCETHTAAVFKAGDRVVKVKKPVRMAFLDFTARDAREESCRREVVLNQRLSPDIYLGVTQLTFPDAEPEPAVVMRRLPEAARLDRLIGTADPRIRPALRDVARQLAALHASGVAFRGADSPGSWSVICRRWVDECDQVDMLGPQFADATTTARIRSLGESFLAGRRDLFDTRVSDERVRDGHGDLRCDSVYALPDGPRVIDCLEFNEQMRIGDVALDVAFLAMDLERLGAQELAADFVRTYQEFSGEHHPASLEDFFIAYRALVRAKVEALRAVQVGQVPQVDGLVELCVRHLCRAVPVVVLIGGLPGSGKSSVSAGLADRRDMAYLSSDELRKDLAGSPHRGEPAVAWESGRYTAELTRQTYDELIARAGQLLALGESVVLDASWSDARHRDQMRAAAAEAHAVVVELCCVVSDCIATRRLGRSRIGSSDADANIRSVMRDVFAPWPEARQLPTGRDVVAAVLDANEVVKQRVAITGLAAALTSTPVVRDASGVRR